MKVAKVLAFYFGDRRFYPHNKLGVMDLFKRQIETHTKINPGMYMDLIIVNHDSGDKETLDFLRLYENHKIFNGKVRIINRPRINFQLSLVTLMIVPNFELNVCEWLSLVRKSKIPARSGAATDT